MSFLIDENLSWRLVGMLKEIFPGCQHIANCGLERASDAEIWVYARRARLTLLSKDDDMKIIVEQKGPPPKLIWMRSGNGTTTQIAESLQQRADTIRDFLDGEEGVLELS